MSFAAVGFEPIADVARRSCVSTRCMRRRLIRLHARLTATYPHEPPLLVKFGERGYFLDRSVAARHARGLVVESVAEEPWEAVTKLLVDWRNEVGASIERIESHLALVRDHLAADR